MELFKSLKMRSYNSLMGLFILLVFLEIIYSCMGLYIIPFFFVTQVD